MDPRYQPAQKRALLTRLCSSAGLLVGLALIGTTGCVTTQLTPEAQAVRVTTNPEAVRGCESLGLVKGADRLQGGMLGGGAAEENAMRRLRNEAGKIGANVVLLMASSGTFGGGKSNQGEAYKCPPVRSDSLPPRASQTL